MRDLGRECAGACLWTGCDGGRARVSWNASSSKIAMKIEPTGAPWSISLDRMGCTPSANTMRTESPFYEQISEQKSTPYSITSQPPYPSMIPFQVYYFRFGFCLAEWLGQIGVVSSCSFCVCAAMTTESQVRGAPMPVATLYHPVGGSQILGTTME
jgi:hypothetical protein